MTPDSPGFAFIAWPIFTKGLPPIAVILTDVAPTLGLDMPIDLLDDVEVPGGAGVEIRVLNQAGQPITTPVRVAYHATKAPTSPLRPEAPPLEAPVRPPRNQEAGPRSGLPPRSDHPPASWPG